MKKILMCIPFFFSCFDRSANVDYQAMIDSGGIILDVRSESEFWSGHIDNSLNIPVGSLSSNLYQLKDKNQPIITCCASGVRSGRARKILIDAGYMNVVNGGGWKRLDSKLH